MSDPDSGPPVACTMTPEQVAERPDVLRGPLTDTYEGVEEHEDGITLVFDGTDEALTAAATFVRHEHRCCAFAEYTIEISPPYETTRLTITGPEGTKQMFRDGMVPRLEAEVGAE